MLSRRTLLKLAAALQLVPLAATAHADTAVPESNLPGPTLGPPQPFSFELLRGRAKTLAASPYQSPPTPDPAIVKTMDYDVAKDTKYDLAHALDPKGPYPVTFLAVGLLSPKSVAMYAIEGGSAREVIFQPDDFITPADSPLRKLAAQPPPFAGFELRQAADKPEQREHEGWARFIGGSYFRAVGESNQFGLSARGLAQNSGVAIPEEFPDFTHFWIGEGKTDRDPVEVYALLDGQSVTGAYRFIMHRGFATTMDITCELHLRKPIERLGIAPMTSMYWYSESVKGKGADWRPEIHDSDGLAMWTGTGEHLWRPLINPPVLQISTFLDQTPKGFGLMQRDHDYDHYLDAVYYERRPCAWVEPIGNWGKGSVQLLEIPTDNEIYDNVVAMWVPEAANHAGDQLDFRYRLYWRDKDPFPGDLALCVATRLGMGAVQGAPRSTVLRKFLLEFQGAILETLDEGEVPEPVVTASRGTFSHFITERSPNGEKNLWRTMFDLDPQGTEPVEMRCFLRYRSKPLTETWTYRYIPFESAER